MAESDELPEIERIPEKGLSQRRDIPIDWPPDFFERVIGSWKDEDIERPNQGILERRAELFPAE